MNYTQLLYIIITKLLVIKFYPKVHQIKLDAISENYFNKIFSKLVLSN